MEKLKKFAKLFFTTPSRKKTMGLIWLMGFIYASLTYIPVYKHTTFLFSIKVGFSVAILLYILPSLVFGALATILFKDMRKNWYALALLNETLLFLGVISLYLLTTTAHILNLMWWWLLLIYGIDFLVFVVFYGKKLNVKSSVFSLSYPLMVVFILYKLFYNHINLGRGLLYENLIILGAVIGGTLAVIYFLEYLFGGNIEGVTLVETLSKFVRGMGDENFYISGLGIRIKALLQSLWIKSGDKHTVLVIPWLHPGPMRGFGGGLLTSRLISYVNKRFDSGFFLHVPSSHEIDTLSIGVVDKIKRGLKMPEKYAGKATGVLKESAGSIMIYGQKIGDVFLFVIDAAHINHYDVSIFYYIRNKFKEKIVFADAHNNKPLKSPKDLQFGEKDMETIEHLIENLMARLKKEPEHSLKIGTSINKNNKMFSFVVQSGRQKNLYFVLDEDGIEKHNKELIKSIAKKHNFDNIIVLTTDTHSENVRDILSEKEYDKNEIEAIIEDSLNNLKSASLGYSESWLENVGVMGNTFMALKNTATILIHLTPVLLGALYLIIGVLLWGLL